MSKREAKARLKINALLDLPLEVQKGYTAAFTAEQEIISSTKSLIMLIGNKINSTLAEICNG